MVVLYSFQLFDFQLIDSHLAQVFEEEMQQGELKT
jgi:hypothetical protein